jgi:hypothetical protein
VLRRGSADDRQRAREAQHLVELLLVAPSAPLRVVEVLPPSAASVPDRLDVAERYGQIQTSFQAGGMTSSRMRSSTSSSSIRSPFSSRYSNPRPRAAPEDPGLAQSLRRRRGIEAVLPCECLAETGGLA